MSLLDKLAQPECWESFYQYKLSLICPKEFAKELRTFIDGKAYLPVLKRLEDKEPFPLARRSVISKQSSHKKRVVYTYPKAENTVLKLLTWLLLREYDGVFADNLYSFRPQRNVKSAVRSLFHLDNIDRCYSYKVDISNYFNSIDIDLVLPQLQDVLGNDEKLYNFLAGLLKEERVLDGKQIIREQKGIMAGTPIACFYANLFLRNLDEYFAQRKVLYGRYSDDIIVFAESRQQIDEYVSIIREYLSEYQLQINQEKEEYHDPEEGFTFLGFRYHQGVIDIAPASVVKLKHKMRRKTRSLKRWSDRNEVEKPKAARAFIRIFNRKLLKSSTDNDLTWSYWYFSTINTTESLHEIDRYAQQCLRYLITSSHRKSAYKVRYEQLKELGYQSLVHAYYGFAGRKAMEKKQSQMAIEE